MNDMVRFELQNRKSGIFSGKHALFLPFNPRFCVMQRSNMQKQGTQILYQYLSTKVCLHSYNDTENANAEVIIENFFRRFSSFEGVQNLKPYNFRSICLILPFLRFRFLCPKY